MNIFDNIPKQLPEELTDILVNSNGVRIERIVSQGHKSAHNFWYDQTENEWFRGLSFLKKNLNLENCFKRIG